MPTIEELWAYLQDKFRASLTATGYSTWIKDAKPVRLTGNTLTIGVPSELHKNYWEKTLSHQSRGMGFCLQQLGDQSGH